MHQKPTCPNDPQHAFRPTGTRKAHGSDVIVWECAVCPSPGEDPSEGGMVVYASQHFGTLYVGIGALVDRPDIPAMIIADSADQTSVFVEGLEKIKDARDFISGYLSDQRLE